MKRVLFLLATLMASLPLWAAEEEEIYLHFTIYNNQSGVYSNKGNADPVKNVYTSRIWATNIWDGSAVCQEYTFPWMSTSNGPGFGQGYYPQVQKFTIDLNKQPVYTICFSPNIYSSVTNK